MAQPQKVYLDSNAIIHFVESGEDQITALFMRAADGGPHLVTSELTLSEVLVVPLRDSDDALASNYKRFIRSDDVMTVVAIDRSILVRSAELRAQFGGKGPDAIHCATAEQAGCRIVVSSDRRLRLADGIVRIDVENADKIGGI